VRRGQAAGLLAGWVASVAAAAMVTWAVLGVALGQILPAAVPSPRLAAISFPHSAPSDQDSSDPDSPARPGPSGSRAGGGDLTPEQVPRERRTGSLLGRQGQVLIACSAARLVNWSVLPAAGWAAAVTGEGPARIQVEFTERGTVMAVIAGCSAGSPRFWHPGEGRRGGSGTGWRATSGEAATDR
jgi:hypothetical protein